MANTLKRNTYSVSRGTLSVLESGSPTAERILLLHGIPDSALLFRDVIPLLAEAGYRALAPDMPGYGETRLADDADYALSAVADLYADWLQAEDLAPVWLVGHDLGTAVAQFIAVRYPQLITHLTLTNGPLGGSFPVPDINQVAWLAKARLLGLLSALGIFPPSSASATMRRAFGDPSKLTDDMLTDIFWDGKVSDAAGRREFSKHLRHLRNDESIAIVPQLADIPVPALVLWGDQDPFQPLETVAQSLRDALPDGSTLERIPGAVHFVPLEASAEYAQHLLDWRRRIQIQ